MDKRKHGRIRTRLRATIKAISPAQAAEETFPLQLPFVLAVQGSCLAAIEPPGQGYWLGLRS